MEILSWNIAGIRTKIQKNHLGFLVNERNYDIVCFQETKGSKDQIEPIIPSQLKILYPYRYYVHCDGKGDQRKGLNGVSIWSRYKAKKRLDVMQCGNNEGRVLGLDFGSFNLVSVYTPNGQQWGSERYNFRTSEWDIHFRNWVNSFNKKTILCGDFNVAHNNLDLHHKWTDKLEEMKHKIVGASILERQNFQNLINDGWIDIFRKRNENEVVYTFWDQRIPIYRKRNIGWRIDYFLINKNLDQFINKADVLTEIMGSDHCPISLSLKLKVPKKYLKIKN